ncbi:transmembrane protein 131 isoform X1 [Hydra vulgaris]|nr:transmembrane protein 131 [Hydra vulgaris]
MCVKAYSFIIIILTIKITILFQLVPSIYGKCGCHKASGQGFFAQERQAINNFEPLSKNIHDGSPSTASVPYSVPNFRILLFEPAFLDFKEQPVGMPNVRPVMLSNPSDKNDIEIAAVIVQPPFHSSKFQKIVLAPLKNITIDLVFLATILGNVENTVYIYTSKGNFPYQVFGVGIKNPYRLRSYVSARIPVNAVFSPYINMYNPYSNSIQINEMYSSGNDLHLDPLSNSNYSSVSKLWEIQPYETKSIMKATYHSKEEGHSARFIRIVVGPPAPPHIIILPFEISVSSKHGLYTSIDILDFGTLRTMDEPKSLNLNVINYGNRSLQITSIQVVPPNSAISIQFSPLVLKPTKKYTKIAIVSFLALNSTHRRQNSGKIVVSTADDSIKLELQYHADVLYGTLAYSFGNASFFTGNSPSSQPLAITNTFNVSLVIYNATLSQEIQNIFYISNFEPPVLIPPGILLSPLTINFIANHSSLSISSVLRLYTNASIFTIPVSCYNGKLEYHIDSASTNKSLLDYGTVGIYENRSLLFTIENNNPIEVLVKEYKTDFEFGRLSLLNVRSSTKMNNKMNIENNTVYSEQKWEKHEFVLKPSFAATFTLDTTATQKEGVFQGHVVIETSYENITIPVNAKMVRGELLARPKKIKIDKAFPGRSENYPISVESTFEYPIRLKNITIYPPDFRFELVLPDLLPEILPKEKTHLGWLKFDPFYGDIKQCYTCICEIDPACEQWHHSIQLPSNAWEMDFNLLEKLRRKWDNFESMHKSSFNTSIVLDSSIVKSYTVPIQVSLAWPSLVDQSIKFPCTQVGNYSFEDILITNPSNHPLIVQVIPLLNYPQPDGGLDLLSDRLIMDSFSLDLNGQSNFFIPEIKDGNQDHKMIHSALGVYPSPNSLTMLLEPRQKKSFKVGFIPVDETLKTSILVVRNNLTVLDLVIVSGQGAQTYFSINGHTPGDKNSILHFEIKPVHLEDCKKSTPKARLYPSFTVKRSFTATNYGQLPVHIAYMNINSYECEGFGFRILNCEPFVLAPNSSHKIDISFSPDFTTSRVARTLKIVTSIGQTMDFALLATLPHHLLPLCADALPRPFWEPYLHVVATVVMSAIFIFIIFFAYFDAQKYVVQCTFTAGRSSTLEKNIDLYTPGKVFDLNAIAGVKVRITDKKDKYNETKLHQRASKSNSCPVSKVNNQPVLKRSDSITSISSSCTRENSTQFSDSSNSSSRKNSNANSPQPCILELKPDTKLESKRSKRKIVDLNKSHTKCETSDSIIITEEINSSWEQNLVEKTVDQKKLKSKSDNEDSQKTKKKMQHIKKETVKHFQKEVVINKLDENMFVEKSPGFKTVENKAKPKKRTDIAAAPYYTPPGNTLDKLDEISLSGPRPDGKENQKKSEKFIKSEPQKVYKQPAVSRKKTSNQFDRDRLIMDTPSSPHAIAAAIVDAALIKSQPKKKNKDKGSEEVSFCNHSESKLNEKGRSSTSSLIHDSYLPTSCKNSPRFNDDFKQPLNDSSSNKTKKKDQSWTSYFKRFGIGYRDELSPDEVSKGNSMFYYDNLSSLRASKQPKFDGTYQKLPENNELPIASNLSPDSVEFVPASQRINKVVGSNLAKHTSWTSADDSEAFRPPPGLTHPNSPVLTHSNNIWSSNEFLSSPCLVNSPHCAPENDRWLQKTLCDYPLDGSYSSLLSGSRNRSKFGFDLLVQEDDPAIWESKKSEFSTNTDFWSTSLKRSSIWDAPELPLNTSPRNRLRLDLSSITDVGSRNANSPISPFNIWGSNVDSATPYEGWNQDIKED